MNSCEFRLPIPPLLAELLLQYVYFGRKPHKLGNLHLLWSFFCPFFNVPPSQHPPVPENTIKNYKRTRNLLGGYTRKNVPHRGV